MQTLKDKFTKYKISKYIRQSWHYSVSIKSEISTICNGAAPDSKDLNLLLASTQSKHQCQPRVTAGTDT